MSVTRCCGTGLIGHRRSRVAAGRPPVRPVMPGFLRWWGGSVGWSWWVGSVWSGGGVPDGGGVGEVDGGAGGGPARAGVRGGPGGRVDRVRPPVGRRTAPPTELNPAPPGGVFGEPGFYFLTPSRTPGEDDPRLALTARSAGPDPRDGSPSGRSLPGSGAVTSAPAAGQGVGPVRSTAGGSLRLRPRSVGAERAAHRSASACGPSPSSPAAVAVWVGDVQFRWA